MRVAVPPPAVQTRPAVARAPGASPQSLQQQQQQQMRRPPPAAVQGSNQAASAKSFPAPLELQVFLLDMVMQYSALRRQVHEIDEALQKGNQVGRPSHFVIVSVS